MRALALAVALSMPSAALADDGLLDALKNFKVRGSLGLTSAKDMATTCVLAAVLAGNGPPTEPNVVVEWCVQASLQTFRIMTPPEPANDSTPK